MRLIFGLLGILINFLPFLIALLVLFFTHKFSFINCFLLFLLLNAINEAIKMQTSAGIYYKTTPATRSIIENNILEGTVNFKQRFVYFILTMASVLLFHWEYTVSILLISGIITFIVKLVG